jgi:hypothetical protein
VLFFENRSVYEILWKTGRSGQATDDRTHAQCMLGTEDYKHTLNKCNTCCFLRRQWLLERASALRYTCIACLVIWSAERSRLILQSVNIAAFEHSEVYIPTTLCVWFLDKTATFPRHSVNWWVCRAFFLWHFLQMDRVLTGLLYKHLFSVTIWKPCTVEKQFVYC